jgi:hypothetical protein
MSDSLGKFVIDLEARIANLESDLGRAARIAQQQARAMQKSFEDGFARMHEAATRGAEGMLDAIQSLTGLNPAQLGFGAVIAGLGEMTKKAIETGDQFNKMAQRTGIGVEALSGIAYAADLSDVAMGDLGTSMEKFARNVAAAAGGSKEQAAAFAAIGVSVKNADGSIRPLDQLLAQVATKFSTYKDGVEKTALAQALFGKSGAAMIPLLNQGSDGLKSAAAEAKALGYNFEGIAGQSEEFNDNLTRMGKAAVGVGADIARELLPTLIAAEERILDFIKSARESGTLQMLGTGIKFVVDNLDTLAVVVGSRLAIGALSTGFAALASSATAGAAAIGILEGALALLGGPVGVLALAAGATYYFATQQNVAEKATDALALALGRVKNVSQDSLPSMQAMTRAALDQAEAALKTAEAELAVAEARQAQYRQAAKADAGGLPNAAGYSSMAAGVATDSVNKLRESIGKLHEEIGKGRLILQTQTDLLAGMGEETKKVAPNVSGLAKAQDQVTQAAQRLQDMMSRDAMELAKLRGEVDPLQQAYQKYVAAIASANKQYQDEKALADAARASLDTYNKIKQTLIDKTKAAQAALTVETDALAKQGDVLGRFMDSIRDQQALIGLTDRQRAMAEAAQRAAEEWKRLADEGKPLKNSLQEVKDGAAAAAGGLFDMQERAKQSEQVAREWRDIWTSGADSVAKALGDFASGAIRKWSDFGKALLDIAKQIVGQIVAQFAKLAFINPMLNAIFGGSSGYSMLPTFASAAGSVLGGGSASAGGAAGAAAGGGQTVFGTAQGGVSLFNAGKTMFAGWQSAFDNFMFGGGSDASGMFGSYSANMYGPGGTFTPSALGYGGAIAGGLYAGYNRYQQGGALGGFAGGATYAVGGTALGLGMASLATGGGFAAGVGAMAGGASAMGASAGVAAAVPIIGWIALAAMLVDMFSGGKLFGTDANKLVGGASTLTVGAGGADVASHYTLKGQKALFGGSYYEEHSFVNQEAIDAANKFFEALKNGTENFAKQFGATMGDIVGGSFEQTFDKKGNVTGSTTNIAGHTYSGESMQDFQQRLVDENMLAVLSQFDSKLQESVDKYRANVQELTDLTQSLAAAQIYFQQGGSMLALGTDQSLSALIKLAEGSMQFGESIGQTIQRLEAAQAQYDQFVGQFKPAVNYVDDFEGALSGIHDQMLANIKQANDLAKAAGAAGASQEDLANIIEFASHQAAQALQALEQSAQSLAFSMGLTTVGSLDEVNAEIARLQQQAGQGSSAIHNFGNAMNTAAQRATDAMNLLLGDLSPLNDTQKLEKARQGLIAGTVTQEQFLQIARRLYGSSQRYVDEFAFAQQFGGRGAGANTPGGGVVGNAPRGGLSAADQQRLSDLLKEQQQLQAAQDLQNAQTLAQQIAEIAAAKGEDWQQVLDDMHIDRAALEKRLNMSDEAFGKYIADIQAKQDDNGENTRSIVQAIYDIGDQITVALGGTPGSHDDGDGATPGHSSHGRPGDVEDFSLPGSRGHSQHGGRNITDDDARAIGREVGRGVRDAGAAMYPRNMRTRTAAA